jgi:rare lipoprotein A
MFDLAIRNEDNRYMKRNVQKPGETRPSTARGLRLGIMAAAMVVASSAIASTVPKEAPNASTSAKRSRFSIQIGKASWYGIKFNGRKTASGERFDMNALTCAHRTLPLGSWVRVTNLHNKKAVMLRVNDRGPVPENVLLDLSYAAAKKLGIGGVAKVKVEPFRADDPVVAKALVAEVRPPQILKYASTLDGVPVLPMMIAYR